MNAVEIVLLIVMANALSVGVVRGFLAVCKRPYPMPPTRPTLVGDEPVPYVPSEPDDLPTYEPGPPDRWFSAGDEADVRQAITLGWRGLPAPPELCKRIDEIAARRAKP